MVLDQQKGKTMRNLQDVRMTTQLAAITAVIDNERFRRQAME